MSRCPTATFGLVPGEAPGALPIEVGVATRVKVRTTGGKRNAQCKRLHHKCLEDRFNAEDNLALCPSATDLIRIKRGAQLKQRRDAQGPS